MKGRGYKMPVHTRVCDERIAELETENKRLREALRDIYKWNVDSREDAFEMQKLASEVLRYKEQGDEI